MKDIHRQRMLEVADLIEERDRFHYQFWTVHVDEDRQPYMDGFVTPWALLDDCNTAGCIGGWTCALAAKKLEFDRRFIVDTGTLGEFASEYLGLDYMGSMAIFHGRTMCHLGWYQTTDDAMSQATGAEAAKLLRMFAYGELELPTYDNPMYVDDVEEAPLFTAPLPPMVAPYSSEGSY